VKVESLEEIFAQKLRALVQRKKVRDYYDIWRMLEQEVNHSKVGRLFLKKLKTKGIEWNGLQDLFPPDLEVVLEGYWGKELGRLVHPVPEMSIVLRQLKISLDWLNSVKAC
jgi:hypothetical protein